MAINLNTDITFDLEETLVAVTDTQLWLSANSTGGGESDSIIINWTAGNRQASMKALYEGMGIRIGDKIRVYGQRGARWADTYWTVMNKVH